MSINSNQIIKKPDVVIDPNFFLPPGVVDARYPSEIEVDQGEIDEVIDVDDVLEVDLEDEQAEIDEPEETGEDNETDKLLPPDTAIVVSQTVRTGENGQQVVDVVLEVPDVDESIQIDVRMTKV
ncbi:hypothetical protein SEA_WOFFORD_63 [Streptomyces phage Wofford]|uniref:Uncharacterized protein n=1 Tax=Streptomyces phage Wofford TaxID=2283267 RepID=A0A345MA97_9CAUD|nr:hypothetical protein HWB78_gp211 [Streptomyces phage Wollford]AXH67418.1 hypothetical protein SEA_WOFFORD_63 [Streptomyces phage Wollford]